MSHASARPTSSAVGALLLRTSSAWLGPASASLGLGLLLAPTRVGLANLLGLAWPNLACPISLRSQIPARASPTKRRVDAPNLGSLATRSPRPNETAPSLAISSRGAYMFRFQSSSEHAHCTLPTEIGQSSQVSLESKAGRQGTGTALTHVTPPDLRLRSRIAHLSPLKMPRTRGASF